jgi:hypothetical protein
MPLQWWWEVLFIKNFLILLRILTRPHEVNHYTVLLVGIALLYILVGIREIYILQVCQLIARALSTESSSVVNLFRGVFQKNQQKTLGLWINLWIKLCTGSCG